MRTRSTCRSSCCAIRSCAAAPSSWRGAARARSSRRLATRRGATAWARRCPLLARAGCAREAVFLPPDFATYREHSRRMMDVVRAHVERVEVVGLDEAYLDLEGLYSPRAAMRRLASEIRARHASALLGRHRAEQARREGRVRRREAGGLRRPHTRAGVRPLRGVAAGARSRHRPEDGGAAASSSACARSRRSPRRPRRCSSSASAPTSDATSGRRARFEHGERVSASRARSSRSRASARSTTTSAIPTSCARRSRGWQSELCEGLAARTRRAGARSGSRCASTTSRR